MNFLAILPNLFGTILDFIYRHLAFLNYGLAIIIFTIFTRLLILPLTMKQLKATAKMQELQPKLAEIQQKYKNDKEKIAQEQMKLYSENGANPMASCLPTLIQLPILYSLYFAIIQPLTYQFHKSKIDVNNLITQYHYVGKAYKELKTAIDAHLLNMDFLGLNLGHIPTLTFDPKYIAYLIFPIVATLCTFLSIKISMKRPGQNQTSDAAKQASQMNNTMMMLMPLMTLWFSFVVPAALTLYWTTGYVIQIIQQLAINKYFYGKTEEAKK